MATFQKATKKHLKLRCALEGPPGSGKTYTALRIGRELVGPEGRIAVIDTERGSASKYSDEFEFDVVELDAFAPATFVEKIQEAEAAGYDLLIIDSLSHAWMGTDGMLDQVDKIAKRKQLSSTFAAWKDASPQEKALWDTMLRSRLHLIATLRTKTEYVIEQVKGNDGKTRSVPRKVGLAPIQRENLEYEFDVVADIDMDHNCVIAKTRCKALTDAVYSKAGKEVADILREWLGSPEAQTSAPAEQPTGETKQPTTERQATDAALNKACNVLSLPPDTFDAVVQRRGFESYCAMPDAAAEQLLQDFRKLYSYCGFNSKSKTKLYTREAMLEELAWEGDGCPLSRLLTEAERAVRELEEVER